jgi:hypothetical protein
LPCGHNFSISNSLALSPSAKGLIETIFSFPLRI